MKDFFISYNKADKDWAEWIAWVLEEAGYSVVIQSWDFRPGGNFVLDMHKATSETRRIIVVLSDYYLNSAYTQPEWAAAFVKDPKGEEGKIVPIRVKECSPTGLLAAIIYVDIVGLSEQDACVAILGAFSTRAKPIKAPKFPASASVEPAIERVVNKKVPYPSSRSIIVGGNLTDSIIMTGDGNTILTAPIQPNLRVPPEAYVTPSNRLELAQNLSTIPSQQFNFLVFALNPPAGIIPPMPTPQNERAYSLLTWAESSGGCGLMEVQKALTALLESGQSDRKEPNGNIAQPQGNAGKLRRLLTEHFSLDELKTLCVDLGVDPDDIVGETKIAKAREMIIYLQRRNQIDRLIYLIKQTRPDINLS